jgi:hypothetical protein
MSTLQLQLLWDGVVISGIRENTSHFLHPARAQRYFILDVTEESTQTVVIKLGLGKKKGLNEFVLYA